MAHARVVEELSASTDATWVWFEDSCDKSAWSPDSSVVSSEGAGLGATRVAESRDGRHVER